MKKIIACTLAVFAAIFVFAQNPSDSVKVYFHISQWQFDPALDGNAGSMEKFIEQVRLAAEAQNLDRIVIRGYASPEGTDRINRLLSVKRCATIASILEEQAGVSPDIIESIPEGVVWGELRRAVAANPAVPSRAKILDILDHTPQWVFDSAGNIISGRKKQLMDLRGGRPWRWMLQHIFPQLRNSVAVSFYLKEIAPAVDPASEPVDESDSGEERYIGVVDIDAFEDTDTDADTGADSEAVDGESEGFESTSAVVMPAGVGEVDPPLSAYCS